ncbi:MAG: Uma2 family endonuclease [Deltaproteobacteria bacterium]|nr:Uma2 family endonuclease [Deltaproteobacteria bacterium]
MARRRTERDTGPFRADQLREGDEYELSHGHPVWCAPQGGRGSRANGAGAEVLGTDPEVESAGVDVGFSPEPGTLRAPDVAVGNVPDAPGWVRGVPLLALEYADTGQDEAGLQRKIQDLLDGGTRVVWVARLVGERRVEVYAPERSMRVMRSGEELLAPGILRNPVPVDALFDRKVAHELVLRNLLQRRGYESLDQVRTEGEAKGRVEGEAKGRIEGEARGRAEDLLAILEARGLPLSEEQRARILASTDRATLSRWVRQAVTAPSVEEALG